VSVDELGWARRRTEADGGLRSEARPGAAAPGATTVSAHRSIARAPWSDLGSRSRPCPCRRCSRCARPGALVAPVVTGPQQELVSRVAAIACKPARCRGP
jgi:hypothetical protein